MPLPSAADALFTAQFNVASRAQLLSILGRGRLNGLLRRGHLVSRHHCVYQQAGVILCERGEAMAALLRCPEGSALSGPVGLKLLGVDGFSRSTAFEVLVPQGSRVRPVDFVARSNPSTAPTRKLGVLTLAAPARLLIDSARPGYEISDEQLWQGYDRMRWNGILTLDRFLRELEAASRRDSGAARWRRIADTRSLTLESPKERELDPLLHRLDPRPEAQVDVTPTRRVDFFWRRYRIAIEYLGAAAHGHEQGRLADAARDAELDAVGVLVVPVVKGDLLEPDALLTHLVDIARARAIELNVDPPALR